MTQQNVDEMLAAMQRAVEQEDEKLALQIGLQIVGSFLKTLIRLAEVRENG